MSLFQPQQHSEIQETISNAQRINRTASPPQTEKLASLSKCIFQIGSHIKLPIEKIVEIQLLFSCLFQT